MIFIPSAGRPNQQPTLMALAKAGLKPALVVQDREYLAYSHWEDDVDVIVLPASITTIAPTRQYILEKLADDKFIMVDDDLTFFRRREDDRTKLRDISSSELEAAFWGIVNALGQTPHVGIAPREGANRNTDTVIMNTRIMRVLGYDKRVLDKEEIRFDEMEVMEDFHVALSLLERGHQNLLMNNYAHNQGGSGASGGCSSFRTPEVQRRAAHRLAELHPGLVRVVQKTTKTAWEGATRTDVVISWKKAYEQSNL